jgi:hypothetical protein
MPNDRVELARESYRAFAAGDRSFFEEHLSDDFTFSSPPDPQLTATGGSSGAGLGRTRARTLSSSGWGLLGVSDQQLEESGIGTPN